MSHEQESTVAVPGVTIQDFASAWGRQESPGYHFNGVDKARLLLGEIRHAVRDGDLKIFDPFLGRERLFRDSDSPTLDRGRIKVLPSSINAWLRSIGMATMPAAKQPPRADAEPAKEGAQRRDEKSAPVASTAPAVRAEPQPGAEQEQGHDEAEEIPGNLPRIAAGRLAVKAAWEIELETGRAATVRAVMQRLQSWADEGKEPADLIRSDQGKRCVFWRTGSGKEKEYDEEQKNRIEINESLEAQGFSSIKEKMDAIHQQALEMTGKAEESAVAKKEYNSYQETVLKE